MCVCVCVCDFVCLRFNLSEATLSRNIKLRQIVHLSWASVTKDNDVRETSQLKMIFEILILKEENDFFLK